MGSVNGNNSYKCRPDRRRGSSLDFENRSCLFLAAHIRRLRSENSMDYHPAARSPGVVCDVWAPSILARMPTDLLLMGPVESGWSMRGYSRVLEPHRGHPQLFVRLHLCGAAVVYPQEHSK